MNSPALLQPEALLSCFSDWHGPLPQRPSPVPTPNLQRLSEFLNRIHLHSLRKIHFLRQPAVMEYRLPIYNFFPLLLTQLKTFLTRFKWFDSAALFKPLPSPTTSFHMPLDPAFSYSDSLQAFLFGRLLLLKECQTFSLDELKQHYLAGYIGIKPGITITKGLPLCHRCKNNVLHRFASHHCERCGKPCLYCRECLEMGVVRECTPLITWQGPLPPPYKGPTDIVWEGKLTEEQVQASTKLNDSVASHQDFLIWAVCGAGKTEILYETIQSFVRQGKRVALAAPRSDVILELESRLNQVFPQIPKAILYGDSPQPYAYTPLVLTTLHQLRRFQNAFDLIIIDEVDAFPFHGNKALNEVLQRALKSMASKVFVTATPTRKMKKDYLNRKLKGIHIPIRFHRAPLPEPVDRWGGNWRVQLAKGRLPKPLMRWIKSCLEKQRVIFLFVPDKKTLSRLVLLLKEKKFSVEGTHSEDPERREKVLAFREGKHSIMVATTILERGITIPFAAVGVLGAETALFDERALVQMAGRAGRDARDPDGEVVFFHYGKTQEMGRAHAHIKFMNKEGAMVNRTTNS